MLGSGSTKPQDTAEERAKNIFNRFSRKLLDLVLTSSFFSRMDENNDGTLTEEEFLKGCLLVIIIKCSYFTFLKCPSYNQSILQPWWQLSSVHISPLKVRFLQSIIWLWPFTFLTIIQSQPGWRALQNAGSKCVHVVDLDYSTWLNISLVSNIY